MLLVQDAEELESKHGEVVIELEEKYNSTKQVKDRADMLKDKAEKLYTDYYTKLQKLKGKATSPVLCAYCTIREEQHSRR